MITNQDIRRMIRYQMRSPRRYTFLRLAARVGGTRRAAFLIIAAARRRRRY